MQVLRHLATLAQISFRMKDGMWQGPVIYVGIAEE